MSRFQLSSHHCKIPHGKATSDNLAADTTGSRTTVSSNDHCNRLDAVPPRVTLPRYRQRYGGKEMERWDTDEREFG
jgi:hypothetical protein